MQLRSRAPVKLSPGQDSVEMQVISWHAEDVPYEDEDAEDADREPGPWGSKTLILKAFGVDAQGDSGCITITDFRPYFYIKLAKEPASAEQVKRRLEMRQERAQGHVRVSLVKLVDFYGYQADCKGTYTKVESRSMQLHRQLIYEVKGWPDAALYESNVDPIIRFCHVRDIKPCSWCRVPAAKYSVHSVELPTTCQFEVTTHWSQVSSMSEREDIGRMLVTSFDIECSSSHGDFPMAVKTYRKLSAELYAEFLKVAEQPRVVQLSAMRACLETAFGIREDEPVAGVSALHFKGHVHCEDARAHISRHLDDVRNILAKTMRVRLEPVVSKARRPFGGRNNGPQDPVRGVLARQLVLKVVPCGKAEQPHTKDDVLTDLDCKLCRGALAALGSSAHPASTAVAAGYPSC
ncbi:hypothetical protein OEZ85_012264 [Tetradesmus obliquus]|uniref:DNA polymerase delta catalytic subunit n=1 Tax=Tetradesmus obliquus TaxID=3088 RepID=A0ABY8TST8_TETOB|nr:hypothetical protein OEZ85_012264 [Tetradesmus obliquus]